MKVSLMKYMYILGLCEGICPEVSLETEYLAIEGIIPAEHEDATRAV